MYPLYAAHEFYQLLRISTEPELRKDAVTIEGLSPPDIKAVLPRFPITDYALVAGGVKIERLSFGGSVGGMCRHNPGGQGRNRTSTDRTVPRVWPEIGPIVEQHTLSKELIHGPVDILVRGIDSPHDCVRVERAELHDGFDDGIFQLTHTSAMPGAGLNPLLGPLAVGHGVVFLDGIVEEKARWREDDPEAFRLIDEGEQWVDAHEGRLKAHLGRNETQQMAREALDEAEAAKESVRNYRKKLHRVKSGVDGLKEQSQENTDRLDEHTDRLGSLHKLAWGSANDIKDLRDSKADEGESRERLRTAKQDLRDENRRLAETVEDAQESIEALREENSALQQRLDAIESELGKSWTEKIRRQ